MIDRLLSAIAPHHCCGCGENGPLLCHSCRNYIIDEAFLSCIYCRKLGKNANLCANHRLPYRHAWCVGLRDGALLELIDSFKFGRAKAGGKVLAEPGRGRFVRPPVTRPISS